MCITDIDVYRSFFTETGVSRLMFLLDLSFSWI